MFSFFLALATAIEKFKGRVHKWNKKPRTKSTDTDNEKNTESDEKKDIENKSIKTKMLSFMTAVVLFFETLPIFLTILFWILVLVVLVVFIVIISTYLTALTAITDMNIPDFTPVDEDTQSPSGVRMEIQWTEEELASRGILLTDYEKNLYRMGIFARKAVEGYGGGKLLVTRGTDDRELASIMLLGIASTETGMRFYTTNGKYAGQNPDISLIPSDIPLNSLGYGFFGLSGSATLNNYHKTVVDFIKGQYTPTEPYSYENQFAPWAVFLGAKHLETKFEAYVNTDVAETKINKAMDEWGIKHNRDYVFSFISHALSHAQYHGAYIEDHKAYIDFLLAFYSATSDNDEERSLTKWTLVNGENNYSESAFRLAVLGETPRDSLGNHKDPSTLQRSSKQTIGLALNGKEIDVPLWRYLWEQFGDKPSFQEAWKTAQKFSTHRNSNGKVSGYTDMVLNFHYGLNSYLQGMRIKTTLSSKLIGGYQGVEGEFLETPGQGQALISGQTTEEYINTWIQNNRNKTGTIGFLNTMKPHWGTSVYLSDPSSLARKSGYEDSRYGVPFYGQGSRFKDSYGTLVWHHEQRDTFNHSGCMVYAHSYTLSALKGKLINPAELASIMIISDSLSPRGIVSGNMEKLYNDKLGLNATLYSNGLQSFDQIKEAVLQGGLAVVRMKKGMYSSGENHFIVLNGVEVKGDKVYYSIYSSSSPQQSMQVHLESTIKANMHRDAMIIKP